MLAKRHWLFNHEQEFSFQYSWKYFIKFKIDETLTCLPERDNAESEKLRTFIGWINGNKPFSVPLRIIREDGKSRHLFVERMIEDRLEAGSMSYFEFLQHLKQNMKSWI